MIDTFYKGTHVPFVISLESLEKVKSFPNNWYAGLSKKTNKFYIQGHIDKRIVKLHRWITNEPKGKVIDHFNGSTLDNTIENLKVVSKKENNQNRVVRKDSSTGIRGVTFASDSNLYRARVHLDGKSKHIGYFKNINDAEKAVIKSRKEIMGHTNEGRIKHAHNG